MIDENKTRSQLIKELHEMQKRIAVLESNCNKEYQAGKTNYEAYEIINNSSMAVIEWRNEEGWPVDFTTDNVENILGYCQDRMLSGHFRYDRIIHPDDLARVQHEVAKFSNEKKCERFVHKPYRILTPKGEERWIEDRTCIGRDEKGNVTHYRGIILDITDRKQAEETAAQFGQILDDSLNEIYIFDVVTLKFIQVNHGAQKNLGYSIEEIKELTPIDIKPEFTLSVFTDIAKPLVSGKKKQVIFETVHKRKNGSTYPVEVHLQISTFNSKPVYVAIILDITKRKQMAEVLEKRIVALTQPLEDVENITFEDLFELSDIQRLQDLYAEAFGVAALITHPDGTPITEQSNFTTLCGEIIRNTPKGVKNCNYSDSMIGKHNPAGPTIQPCLSAGLCNAGASITVGGRHIANWLIGQVRNEAQKEEEIMPYAREIGVDEEAFRAAYRK
ncbi:MAG: PocR ligand-binding domain-containing protein, partial [Desulfobacteraceae bacterium]